MLLLGKIVIGSFLLLTLGPLLLKIAMFIAALTLLVIATPFVFLARAFSSSAPGPQLSPAPQYARAPQHSNDNDPWARLQAQHAQATRDGTFDRMHQEIREDRDGTFARLSAGLGNSGTARNFTPMSRQQTQQPRSTFSIRQLPDDDEPMPDHNQQPSFFSRVTNSWW